MPHHAIVRKEAVTVAISSASSVWAWNRCASSDTYVPCSSSAQPKNVSTVDYAACHAHLQLVVAGYRQLDPLLLHTVVIVSVLYCVILQIFRAFKISVASDHGAFGFV